MRAVYYAVNDTEPYSDYLKNSILSIRKYSELPIYIIFFGEPDLLRNHKLELLGNLQIIFKNRPEPQYQTSLKWLALDELKNHNFDQLLFLDADTFCFSDIESFFELYQQQSFYARNEINKSQKHAVSYIIRNHKFKPPYLFHSDYEQILSVLSLSARPVFNTGVMLFNDNFHKIINKLLPDYLHLFNHFIDRQHFIFADKKISQTLSYPCNNIHILEEIVFSLSLGKLNEFNYDFIQKEISPWFIEFYLKQVESHGIIMHIWSNFYHEFENMNVFG